MTVTIDPKQLRNPDTCPGCGATHELRSRRNQCQEREADRNAVQAQPGPERLEVEMTYRIPEPAMHSVVAGACYAAMHNALAAVLVMRWRLPRNGRRG